MMLSPAALFVCITGQISAIVMLAALVAAGELARLGHGPRRWLVAMCLTVTAFKPNMIWLPVRRVLALAFALCWVVTPCSRSYDHVILILPPLAALAGPAGVGRYVRFALVVATWLAPLVTPVVLAPVLATLAVFLAFPPPRLLTHINLVQVSNA